MAPSAHDDDPRKSLRDTFARDHLPPRSQWPELVFERPELQYPPRLNCAAELLDRMVAAGHGERPALWAPVSSLWARTSHAPTCRRLPSSRLHRPRIRRHRTRRCRRRRSRSLRGCGRRSSRNAGRPGCRPGSPHLRRAMFEWECSRSRFRRARHRRRPRPDSRTRRCRHRRRRIQGVDGAVRACVFPVRNYGGRCLRATTDRRAGTRTDFRTRWLTGVPRWSDPGPVPVLPMPARSAG